MRTVITSWSIATLAIAASAVLSAPAAVAQSSNGAYCLTSSDSGTEDCAYDSMAQCEQAKSGQLDSCGINHDIIDQTVGFGGAAHPNISPYDVPRARWVDPPGPTTR